MRVRIGIAAAALAALAACAVAAVSAASGEPREPATGPDPAVSTWTEWPHEVSCHHGLPFDPVAAFSGPTRAERGSSSSAGALRRILASGELPRVRQHGWRLLGETNRVAEFVAGPLFDEPYPGSTPELEWIQLRRSEGGWGLEAFTSSCTPQSIRRGVPATPWSLVPGEHLNAGTRRVRIQPAPIECLGNAKPRVLAREVREQNDALLLTIWLPVKRGTSYCAAVVPAPLLITLPEKLGDRELRDGGVYPPRPAVRPLYG
jgi:hypothetical protein